MSPHDNFVTTPHDRNFHILWKSFHTPWKKLHPPPWKKLHPPHEKNFTYNNTSIIIQERIRNSRALFRFAFFEEKNKKDEHQGQPLLIEIRNLWPITKRIWWAEDTGKFRPEITKNYILRTLNKEKRKLYYRVMRCERPHNTKWAH